MIYVGSGAEYDRQNYIEKMSEEYFDTNVPYDDYGYAKYLINKSILKSDNIYNLRVFGLFGKHEYWPNKFISLSCCKVILNIPISIREDAYFDWLYIDDFLKIVNWFINSEPKYKDYNICSGKAISLSEVAQIINNVESKDLPIFVCKNTIRSEYSGDNTRLISEIGDIDFQDIGSSIMELYLYYKKKIDEIDPSLIFYLNDKY